jgi:hypothetical protein
MGYKITNVPLIFKIWEIIFGFWANYFMGHFLGYFEGASTFLTPKLRYLTIFFFHAYFIIHLLSRLVAQLKNHPRGSETRFQLRPAG